MSAEAFGDDLKRFLTDRPIEARPDSIAYVASRFVRRNRGGVLLSILAVLSLVIGLGVSLSSLSDEHAARLEAERSAALASEATNLLTRLFVQANPIVTNGEEVTARDMLRMGLEETASAESPDLRAFLLHSFGRVYEGIGDAIRSDSLHTLALAELNQTQVQPEARVDILYGLARSRGNLKLFSEALPLLLEAQELARTVSPQHYFRITRDLSWIYRNLERDEDALRVARESVALARQEGNAEWVELALYELGSTLLEMNRAAEAITPLREARRIIVDSLGTDHVDAVYNNSVLAEALAQTGAYEEAGALLEHALQVYVSRLGPTHDRTLTVMETQVRFFHELGEPQRTLDVLTEAVAVQQGAPEAAPQRVRALILAAEIARQRGRWAEGRAYAQQAVQMAEDAPNVQAVSTAEALLQWGLSLEGLGRFSDALRVLTQASAALPLDSMRGDDLKDRIQQARTRIGARIGA